MKKFIIFLLSTMLILQQTAMAFNYPSAFWSVNNNYINALSVKDYPDIIRYGEETVELMKTLPDGPEKRDIIITRLNEIGIAYAEIGEYEKGAEALSELMTYTDLNDPKYSDYYKGAKARVLQYKPRADIYIDGGDEIYFGGKNEPRNGVLFGTCADGGTRERIPNESMELTYQELGAGLLPYNERVMAEAERNSSAVLFALNCPNEGDDIRNIKNYTLSLREVSDLFGRYPDVPVYLRFGAEFDVWGNSVRAEEYKNTFRYVADYFHGRNSNVAVVWSPNHISNWNTNRDEYYPGDSYVDWVGVSLYSIKYFLGDENQSEFNNIFFRTGESSDSVLATEDIIKTYGNRKPIMISEYGAGHKLLKTGEDLKDFALMRMRETYSYLPVIYPQIKLIAYFDASGRNGVDIYDYRLSNNSLMQNEFVHLTRGGRFIEEDYKNTSTVAYRHVKDGMNADSIFEAVTYGHSYKKEINKVTYFIDGNYAGMSYDIPYNTHIDARSYGGSHTLKSIIEFTDGTLKETQAVINIAESKDITVTMNGHRIEFSQDPVIYHDTTMVPVRKIFEELGMTVSWDGETRTVTAKGMGKTIELVIGESEMFVNGKPYILVTAPIVLSGSTLVPARAISEAMDCRVEWLGEIHQVKIEH